MLPLLWKSTLVSGILSLILGGLMVAWPRITILVAAVLFGIYLLVTGIAQVAFAFGLHVSAGSRILLFISGALALILALLVFRQFSNAVWLLAIWIAIGFIFRGVATIVSAFTHPAPPGRVWAIILGVISLIAGVIVLESPIRSLHILAIVVGAWFIVIGVFEIIASLGFRKATTTAHG